MHIDEIWRYEVKSMLGGTVPHARLGATGIEGDRRWAVRDLTTGGITGAKRLGVLMRCAARRIDDDTVEITLPDGDIVRSSDSDVDARLSAAVGREVRLERIAPADDLDFYRPGRPECDDIMSEVRALMGREGDEPLPDFSIFPPEVLQYAAPPGALYDAFPLMIMTTSGMRSLAEALPASKIDIRRFRPSFVIDTGDAPGYPELAWPTGSQWRVGGSTIRIDGPCPRCVMPTREVAADLPQDRSILRYIVRELDQCIGTYASVVEPGPIAAGDPVSPR